MKSIIIPVALLLVGGNVTWGDMVGPIFEAFACPSNGICDEGSTFSNITAGTPSAQFNVPGFNFDSSAMGYAFTPDASALNNLTVAHDGGIGLVLDDYSQSYDECCDLPAVPQRADTGGRDHPLDAPKPAAWLLLATGLAAVIRQFCS